MGLLGDASVKTKELFAFNLIPPKTEEELVTAAKKADRNFYSIMFPGFILVLALILFFFNNIVLKTSINNWNTAAESLSNELNNPNNFLGGLKIRNGELKVKADFIADPVKKNVDFDNIFTITERVFEGNGSGSTITSYGREDDGEFIVNAVSRTVDGPSEILEEFLSQPEIGDADIRLVQKPTGANDFRFTISFEIIAIEEVNSDTNTNTTTNTNNITQQTP